MRCASHKWLTLRVRLTNVQFVSLKTLPPKQSPLLTHLTRGQFAHAKFALRGALHGQLAACVDAMDRRGVGHFGGGISGWLRRGAGAGG